MADMKGNFVETNVQNEEFTQENDIVKQEVSVEVVTTRENTAWVKPEMHDAQGVDKPVVEIEEVYVQEIRAPSPPSGIFKFAAYFVAYILLFNFMELTDTDSAVYQTMLLTKTLTGLVGLITICRSKTNFTGVKLYSVVLLFVYIASFSVRGYFVHQYQNEFMDDICSNSEADLNMTRAECVSSVWFTICVRLFCSAMYGLVAFMMTWSYAIRSERYQLELLQFEKQESEELPPV